MDGARINSFREMNAVVYDSGGAIVGRETQIWMKFGVFQSFSITFYDVKRKPARIKVFPSRSG